MNGTGDRTGAEENYHRALALAKRQSAKVFELRAATTSLTTEGLDTPSSAEAKVLLEQLERRARSARQSHRPGGVLLHESVLRDRGDLA